MSILRSWSTVSDWTTISPTDAMASSSSSRSATYFDCGPANLEAWDEIVALGLAIDWDGKGWYKLTKTGFEALSSATGIHIHEEEAAFVPALPKRLYVIGPGIIDSAGDDAVFEEAAEKLEGVDHLVRIPKDLVVENIDEPTAIRNGIHELANPWDFFDGIALLPGWEASEGVSSWLRLPRPAIWPAIWPARQWKNG